jgi:uncharacterized membrane protein (UPF0127 family)
VLEAAGLRARTLGLAGLPALAPELGLHIPGCRSVHTVGMRFALDLLWLDGRGQVLRVDRGVGPRRVAGCRRARSVLEVRAGEAGRFLAALGAQSGAPSDR